jgi:hypothetical protein
VDVTDLMRQCNGHAPPSKALVKGLAKELDIDESFLNRLRIDRLILFGVER